MKKKQKQNKKRLLIVVLFIILILIIVASFLFTPSFFVTSYENGSEYVAQVTEELFEDVSIPEEVVRHIETPEEVKTIYMTACVAGTPSFRDNLVQLVEDTELNSIIIDIKDFSGTISYDTDNPKLLGVNGTGCRAKDMKDFVKTLHEKGIYVIGRITVFQDPYYTSIRPDLAVKKASNGAIWEDYKGISFIEVGARDYWEYIVELSKESYALGFDELNFDYVRFPSDGNMKDIYFPFSNKTITNNPTDGKAIALEEFFEYLSLELEGLGVTTSADLFGMVTTNTDDLNIGQVLERALPYFDYIAPMVYPSHYPAHFNGWADPNMYPYELIYFVMSEGAERAEALRNATTTPQSVRDHVSSDQLRPWLQDFDYGGNYDVAEVRAQIKATYDAGLDSWMLWASSNRYTAGALNAE